MTWPTGTAPGESGIRPGSVAEMGVAWETDNLLAGAPGTPIVADSVVHVGDWTGNVRAFDAAYPRHDRFRHALVEVGGDGPVDAFFMRGRAGDAGRRPRVLGHQTGPAAAVSIGFGAPAGCLA